MEGLLQPTHLILILGIALLMFGPRKLPELGQGLGKGIRGFRDALRGISVEHGSPVSRHTHSPRTRDPQVPTIPSRQSSCAEWCAQNSRGRKVRVCATRSLASYRFEVDLEPHNYSRVQFITRPGIFS